MQQSIERVLLTEEQILGRIDEVAAAVTEIYRGRDLTVVSVLKGSCIFAADLIRRIPIPLQLAFVSASSYGDETVAGKLSISFLPNENEIAGRNLLLIDDILDTGNTLNLIKRELLGRGAREVSTCVFLDKPARRSVEFEADLRCFEIDNLFVVGYGLDFAGHYRNLPYVASLKEEAVQPGALTAD